MSKVLGIDFGLKRIGLALGYEEFKMSFPYKTLEKKDNESLFIELKEIVKKEDIKKIVIGIPRYLNGEESLTTRQVKNFIKRLNSKLGLPVLSVDEALTSFEAEKILKFSASKKKLKDKKNIDQLAAVIILDSYFQTTS